MILLPTIHSPQLILMRCASVFETRIIVKVKGEVGYWYELADENPQCISMGLKNMLCTVHYSKQYHKWNMKPNEFQTFQFLVIKNITVPLQKGIIWYGWFTTKDTSLTNNSITFLNVYNNCRVYERQFRWHYWYTYHWNKFWQWLYLYMIWSAKAINIEILDPKVNWFRGDTLYQNMKNHLFTLTTRLY